MIYPPHWKGACTWHECAEHSVVILNGAELCQQHFDMEMAAMGQMLRTMIQEAIADV